jgi:hypothetical protein
MAHNAPDTLTDEVIIAVVLLVLVQLVVGKDLEGEPGTEDEDGEVVSPLQRS